MRVAFGALAVVLSLPAVAPANPPATPDVRYVRDAETEVRCQPSTNPKCYPTNRLPKGDAIEVVEEMPDGWLKIRPPHGSFSWINVNNLYHIAPNQPNEVITTNEPAPVYIGSEIQKGRPTVVGARLQRGTQVRSIGRPLAGDSTAPGEAGPWMPIEAPEGEFRYVRAEDVSKTRPAVDTVAAARPPTGGTPTGSSFTPLAGSAASAPPVGNAITPVPDVRALYDRALEAEHAGNFRDAIPLWEQVAATVQNQGNAQQAREYAARASALRQRLQGAPPGDARTAAGQSPAPAGSTVRLAAPPGTTPAGPGPDYANAGAPAVLTARGSPAANLPSSGPGRLRRAGRTVEYQRTYVLEDAQGLPRLYVTPEPGIDLEPYVEHNVELFGHTAYRGDIRAYYMTVARVQPLP
jgi:hypothetical protein